jgi:hypothetical protein
VTTSAQALSGRVITSATLAGEIDRGLFDAGVPFRPQRRQLVLGVTSSALPKPTVVSATAMTSKKSSPAITVSPGSGRGAVSGSSGIVVSTGPAGASAPSPLTTMRPITPATTSTTAAAGAANAMPTGAGGDARTARERRSRRPRREAGEPGREVGLLRHRTPPSGHGDGCGRRAGSTSPCRR